MPPQTSSSARRPCDPFATEGLLLGIGRQKPAGFVRATCASDRETVDFGGSERSDKRVFELGFYLKRLISDKAIFESAGFGFESRGAHYKTPGQTGTSCD
jgi:hypothetical protein